jgi:hypothetical protein
MPSRGSACDWRRGGDGGRVGSLVGAFGTDAAEQPGGCSRVVAAELAVRAACRVWTLAGCVAVGGGRGVQRAAYRRMRVGVACDRGLTYGVAAGRFSPPNVRSEGQLYTFAATRLACTLLARPLKHQTQGTKACPRGSIRLCHMEPGLIQAIPSPARRGGKGRYTNPSSAAPLPARPCRSPRREPARLPSPTDHPCDHRKTHCSTPNWEQSMHLVSRDIHTYTHTHIHIYTPGQSHAVFALENMQRNTMYIPIQSTLTLTALRPPPIPSSPTPEPVLNPEPRKSSIPTRNLGCVLLRRCALQHHAAQNQGTATHLRCILVNTANGCCIANGWAPSISSPSSMIVQSSSNSSLLSSSCFVCFLMSVRARSSSR